MSESIHCPACDYTHTDALSVYYRWCPSCEVMLGPPIRQKWNKRLDWLIQLCNAEGLYKRVIGPDGIPRAVPTETILTEGIRGGDLKKFPAWQ